MKIIGLRCGLAGGDAGRDVWRDCTAPRPVTRRVENPRQRGAARARISSPGRGQREEGAGAMVFASWTLVLLHHPSSVPGIQWLIPYGHFQSCRIASGRKDIGTIQRL